MPYHPRRSTNRLPIDSLVRKPAPLRTLKSERTIKPTDPSFMLICGPRAVCQPRALARDRIGVRPRTGISLRGVSRQGRGVLWARSGISSWGGGLFHRHRSSPTPGRSLVSVGDRMRWGDLPLVEIGTRSRSIAGGDYPRSRMGPVSHLVDRLVFESEGRRGTTRQATPAVHRLEKTCEETLDSILWKCPTRRFPNIQKLVSRRAGEDSPECSSPKTPASRLREGFPVDFVVECRHKCIV